jgi:SAM-dependent methyltransferase
MLKRRLVKGTESKSICAVSAEPELRCLNLYNAKAKQYCEDYEALTFEEVHAPILDLLPPPPAYALDVGAGSGRDAAALAKKGYCVVAVEPSQDMRKQASILHGDKHIKWSDDALPKLSETRGKGIRFDVILASAVWMHIAPEDRDQAFDSLIHCLGKHGLLFLTLRNGMPVPERSIYSVSRQEVYRLGKRYGAKLIKECETADSFGRSNITWTTLAFRKQGRLPH